VVTKVKVLIIGYVCDPLNGGENSHTWNWAWHLSRFHKVWVLAHPGYRPRVEALLAEHPSPNVRFHWLDGPRLLWDHRGGNVALVIHYLRWLNAAYAKAAELHGQIGFDVVHHVSYGTINAPPPIWKLRVPFVWGPVGGAQRVPTAFGQYMRSFSGPEILRGIRAAFLPYSISLQKAAKSSAITLATNRETHELLARLGAPDVRLFLDTGISSALLSSPRNPRREGGPFTLLWVGRMQPRKALAVALEALAQTNGLNTRLLVAGDGEMREDWETYTKRLNLDGKAEFLGKVQWREMSRAYQSADAFLFTSLRDSFGSQVLEAMGHGLPILTLDHQGVGTFVPPDAGIKVPVTTPAQTVAELAKGIQRLASCPEERLKMGEAARAYARTQTWESRAEHMSGLYEEALRRPACRHQKVASAVSAMNRPIQIAGDHVSFRVLGVRIDAMLISETVAQMEEWIRDRRECHSIAATSVHGTVEAQRDASFRGVLSSMDLVVPDGMPLVWLGRRRGCHLPRRVYGPDLMLAFCEQTAGRGYRHFFYGGEPGVPQRLAESLKRRFPAMQVCGTFSPPFRPLDPEEDQEIGTMIRRAAPDVLWVGLGTPKQERWMCEHQDKLNVPVLLSVGAAFDMLSGTRKQAPRWMRDHGFEWCFRLMQEPRRLWRRYLVYGSQFIIYLLLESLRLKNFEADGSRLPKRTPGCQAPV
jgi:exopolysaccharide biosynthesis WecB/TagA/CpsF family protein